jgi:hypothetical protein
MAVVRDLPSNRVPLVDAELEVINRAVEALVLDQGLINGLAIRQLFARIGLILAPVPGFVGC